MTRKTKENSINQSDKDISSGTANIATGPVTIKREQCPKFHALCEGQCKLDKGHEGKHECQECSLYFG